MFASYLQSRTRSRMQYRRHRMQYLTAVTASLIQMAYGTFMGWPSTTIPILESEGSPIPLSADQGSWLASINSLSSLVTILTAGYAIDTLGRRKLILASAVPILVWCVMVALASSYEMLMAARVIGSLTAGMVATTCGVYLCEIADTDIRGKLVTLQIVFQQSGNLFIYCVAPYVSITTAALICASLPVSFFVTFYWMPESPYFFLLRHEEQKAITSLIRLKGELRPEELKLELDAMYEAIRQRQEAEGKLKDLFLMPVHRRTLLIVIGFIVLQMSTGAIALLTYTTYIFEKSGSGLDPNVSSIILSAATLVANVVASLIVDRVGRRPLAMGSFLICCTCLAAEGAYFYLEDVQGTVPSAFDWLPLTAMIGFNVSFNVGAGPVLSIFMAEVFHLSVKAASTSIGCTVMYLYGFFLKKMFQVVSDNLGAYYSFWGFSVMCVCATVYVYFLVPETKGKTFAQINEEKDVRLGGGPAGIPIGSLARTHK